MFGLPMLPAGVAIIRDGNDVTVALHFPFNNLDEVDSAAKLFEEWISAFMEAQGYNLELVMTEEKYDA